MNSPPGQTTDKPTYRILVADDEDHIRKLVRITLSRSERITVIEATNGMGLLKLAEEQQPDLLILDNKMPGMSGLECCRALRARRAFAAVPIILLTAHDSAQDRRAALAAGATEFLTKPFSPRSLVDLVERHLGVESAASAPSGLAARPSSSNPVEQLLLYAADLSSSMEEMRTAHRRLQAAYLGTVDALASALETRDVETAGHCRRVAASTVELARLLAVTAEQLPAIQFGAMLHDVGKIGVPDAILCKPGKLTEEEWRVMRRHPELGERMLQGLEFLQEALPIIGAHHERWDGQGYPQGLAGAAIPMGARIFAIADTLDAMLSDRPYRASLPWERAVAEILAGAGSQFDPQVVEVFQQHAERLTALYRDPASAQG